MSRQEETRNPLDVLDVVIQYAWRAHHDQPRSASKAVRRWDGHTPHAIHPIWCAMTILTETTLAENLRVRGAWALLLHDLLEDTTAHLPESTPPEVRDLVEKMTFASSNQEMTDVWSRGPECRLLKLYDKVSNLLDGAWMDAEKTSTYGVYARHLADDVETTYGRLNIVRIARAVLAETGGPA